MGWNPPNITLKWGDYFAPDADDDAKLVASAIQAHDGGLVTLRAAVQKIKRPFDIENVDQFVETLEDEKLERQKQQMQQAADMMSLQTANEPDGDEPKAPNGGRPKPGARARSGGRPKPGGPGKENG